ncbi:SAM-dependent methyltransferase [Pedobacter immunditicola]|uniref:SAM-dependent methyltransferase n=1 Tax=Pedobacter immunditicola TaxID=3133440 RepID=UPI0030969C5C
MKSVKILMSLMVLSVCGSTLLNAQVKTEPRAKEKPVLDVPYVPTRQTVVNSMLKIANVKKGDVLYDLGCGDGRIVVTAARDFGATGKGFDIDPQRIEEANANAKKAGVSDKVKFVNANLFETDLSKATVITMYLLPDVNMKLRPKILALKPGTRIVSHAFDMGDWKPDRTEVVDGATIHYWTVPARKK